MSRAFSLSALTAATAFSSMAFASAGNPFGACAWAVYIIRRHEAAASANSEIFIFKSSLDSREWRDRGMAAHLRRTALAMDCSGPFALRQPKRRPRAGLPAEAGERRVGSGDAGFISAVRGREEIGRAGFAGKKQPVVDRHGEPG